MEGKDSANGRFLPGNRWWEARSTHGRKTEYTPDELWIHAQEYFAWNEANPLHEEKLFCFQGDIIRTTVSKMRAMTVQALCIFLEIESRTFRSWKDRSEFLPVIAKIEEVIYSQKFSGAAADLFNANIIARDLGLADKQDVTAKHQHTIMDHPESVDEWEKTNCK